MVPPQCPELATRASVPMDAVLGFPHAGQGAAGCARDNGNQLP
jgi:hypothetical protein